MKGIGVKMDIEFRVEGNVMYIGLPKDMDCNNAKKVREEADKIMNKENIRNVIFDFKKTDFMDSTGIGVIMGRYKNANMAGGSVFAINVSSAIKRILTLSGVHRLISINEVSGLKIPIN